MVKVYLNEITGVADALESMYMSKRTWTPQLAKEIRDDCRNMYGYIANWGAYDMTKSRLDTFCKYAWKHTVMLDFITISVTVEGLHRAGQDDWDAHACRYNNRIIRSSTRLADFDEDEMSDFYTGKIIPTEVALDMLGITLPPTLTTDDGQMYVKTEGGYIREDLKDNRDVKRGLYRLCIPSTFIFKCNLAQWAHVYRMRNASGTANPEVKEVAEKIQDALQEKLPWFDREFMQKVLI